MFTLRELLWVSYDILTGLLQSDLYGLTENALLENAGKVPQTTVASLEGGRYGYSTQKTISTNRAVSRV